MFVDLVDLPVFGTPQAEKEQVLRDELWRLTRHHRERCAPYRRLLDTLGTGEEGALADVPFVPVRLFKEIELKSIPDSEVFRTLTSSGTTSSLVSRIYLDADAAQRQARSLSATIQDVLGPHRLPMLVIDSRSVTRGRSFSARGAGVLGMMNFGRHPVFALDDELRLDVEAVRAFLQRFGDEPFLVFGFTFMVWEFLDQLRREGELDLSNGILIHSGGWKKLIDRAVDPQTFRSRLLERTGLRSIHNFYGMVEQIGTVFIESPAGDGTLTCPGFADVIVRDPVTLAALPAGEIGVIQTVSLLPRSYPGHSVLTEDLGRIVGVDDTRRLGTRFEVLGRLSRAEVRGCSDTFAA